ncbi:hypothetical protein MO973_06820 [Paenibacillus sp. TRM 82003]|nr:hypothetical protein [Paenibacillus sp. TRM 82003]
MDQLATLQRTLLRLTNEMIADCSFCVSIAEDCKEKTPVRCTKWSGSAFPVSVNSATCLTCGEYRKSTIVT